MPELFDLYMMGKAPTIEVGPTGLVDLVWDGPRGRRVIMSLTRKQAWKLVDRLWRALDEAPHPESCSGEPGVGGPS